LSTISNDYSRPDVAYFNVVDLLDGLGVLAGGSQSVHCVGRDTTDPTSLQELSDLQEPTGESRFSHRAREYRLLLLPFLMLKQFQICVHMYHMYCISWNRIE